MKNTETPKEVIMYEEFDGCDENGKPIERVFYGCPVCGNTVVPYQDTCSRCNQNLSW